MSTQYIDHDTPQRPIEKPRLAPRNIDPLDHRHLALEWLQCEESIPALRVADPGRGRFSPWRETPDPDTPQHWVPASSPNLHIDQLCRDYRLLLAVHAQRTIWRRPYSPWD
jgi:hypothetical protein